MFWATLIQMHVPYSQCIPVNLVLHEHLYLPSPSKHVPSFWHGLLGHVRSTTIRQIRKTSIHFDINSLYNTKQRVYIADICLTMPDTYTTSQPEQCNVTNEVIDTNGSVNTEYATHQQHMLVQENRLNICICIRSLDPDKCRRGRTGHLHSRLRLHVER